MAGTQGAQRIEVVAFDDEVVPGRVAVAERRVQRQRDEVAVDRVVGLDLVPFPHQSQLTFGVAALQQADQGVAIERVVVRHYWTSCCGSA